MLQTRLAGESLGIWEPKQFRVESKLCQECREKLGTERKLEGSEGRGKEEEKSTPGPQALAETRVWPGVWMPGSEFSLMTAVPEANSATRSDPFGFHLAEKQATLDFSL